MSYTTQSQNNYIDIYSRVYSILNERTPVMFDCGKLCSSACCKDNGLGMLLFPHEESYLKLNDNEFTIKDSNIVIDNYNVKLLYCKGTCNRNVRPLACRIFPLFPYTYKDNRITIKFDSRASVTCPLLLTDLDGIYMSGIFRLMVYKASIILLEDPLIRSYLTHLTKELDTIADFI